MLYQCRMTSVGFLGLANSSIFMNFIDSLPSFRGEAAAVEHSGGLSLNT